MKISYLVLLSFVIARASDTKKCIVVIDRNVNEYIECTNVANFEEIAHEWDPIWTSLHIVNKRPGVHLTISELSRNIKNSVTELDLSKAKQINLINRGFRDFEVLKSLNLAKTGLDHIESNWFLNLKLENLDLSGNEIENIESENLFSLRKLKKLSLASNGFGSFNENLFKSLTKLNTLDLSFNSLQNIKHFGSVPHLKNLKISDNLISEISKEEFAALPDLEQLDLSYNAIHKIENCAFSDLANLLEINLSGNNLATITTGLFSGMTNRNLRGLNLSENKIQNLENRCFDGLYSLEQLDLTRNNLAELNEFSFTGLRTLKRLNLSDNVILNMQVKTFQSTPQLEILDLSGNRVQTIDEGIFGSSGGKLRKFILARNQLLVMQPHLFEPIRNIDSFDASHNQLKYFDENLFQPLVKITKINLTHNSIDDIPAKILNELTSLREIYIAYNKLTFLRPTSNTFRKLRKVSIEGNPWQCPCLDEIINFLSAKGVELQGLHFEGQKSICIQTSVPYCIKDIQRIRDEHITDLYKSL